MKEAFVQPSLDVEIKDSPIPSPGERDVIVKNVVVGTNPKDWKYPIWQNETLNSGDDIAGIVHSVGSKVCEFKPEDKVAGFHKMLSSGGAFAEYSVLEDHATFHLPASVDYEEAATIPLAAMTAALGIFRDLQIPEPWTQESTAEPRPFLVYGASSAVGAFGAQLARLANLKPIIGVAGRANKLAQSLCDYVVDYRNGEDETVAGIQEALKKSGTKFPLKHCFDGISEKGSHETIARVLDQAEGSIVSHVLPPETFAQTKDFKYPKGIKPVSTYVGQSHNDQKDFAYVWFRYIGRSLEDGRLKGHPYEVIPGGLEGIKTGLAKLKAGEASGVKYVYRIEDTK